MALTPGQKLGPYEIVSPLGAGGMGEVYRARDTRLDREVAVKVLPASLSQNAAVHARFEREAKTISSLNHPHICVLHDVGREGEIEFLVMELVDGETLAQRLEKGPLPTSEVLKIGAQIADALDRAHRAGVVHRDLKPANVMLTRSGAKLMDFGLARVADASGAPGAAGASITASQSPTVAQPLTAEGSIVGTFQYMAPEQLEGKEADARADLWALGCLLYEMATGRRTFEGQSQASLIGSIMHAEPRPVSALAPLAPPELDRLVAACLTKNADDRVQSAHDIKLQLTWLAEGASSVTGVSAPVAPTPTAAAAESRRNRVLLLAAVALASAALAVLVMLLGPFRGTTETVPPSPQRYVLAAADLRPASAPMLSPDGSYVVYAAREGITSRLYRRDLASFQTVPIAGTEDGLAPFFSPDGAWIGFVTPEALKRVPAGGGVAQVIISEARISMGEWSPDGMIYVSQRGGGQDGNIALARVPAGGGTLEVIGRLDTDVGEFESWIPELLPDGKTVLVSIVGTGLQRIVAFREDGSRTTVVEKGFLARYVDPGYLIYRDLDSEAVVVAPFDADSAQLTGPAVPLTEQVDNSYCYDVSADGKLVYVPQPGAGEGDEIVWLDRNGASSAALDTRSTWMQPRVSPDGTRLLLRKAGTSCELWLFDVERESLVRIIHDYDAHDAVWGPDGRTISYHRVDSGELVTQTISGVRKAEVLAKGGEAGGPTSWSGNRIAYTVRGGTTRNDIWVRSLDGSGAGAEFLATEFNESAAAFSPDGKWLAYVSDESGIQEVLVRSYPDTGEAWQVSTGGGRSPVWSTDGSELFFVFEDQLTAVPMQTGATLNVGIPVLLFEGNLGDSRVRDFDIRPVGGFVSVRRAGGDRGQQELRMLLSWQQVMRQTAGGLPH